MPNYSGFIRLNDKQVTPGGIIAGQVTYTPHKRCTLVGAELKLVRTVYYYDKGNAKKKVSLDKLAIAIPLLHNDGRTTIQTKEQMTEANRQAVFQFERQLPDDLLPTTVGGTRNFLHVTYALQLSSKRGLFRRRQQDYELAVTVASVLDLKREPLSKMARDKVFVQDAFFGQGFDVLASASLRKFGWERGSRVPVKLTVIRMSDDKSYIFTAHLERKIRFKDKSTVTKIASSSPTITTWESEEACNAFSDTLTVDIPGDTPLSGVMFCPDVSIQYGIKVEVKLADLNRPPTFAIYLPIVIGSKRKSSPRRASSHEGESKLDLLRGPSLPSTSRMILEGQMSRSSQDEQLSCSSQHMSRSSQHGHLSHSKELQLTQSSEGTQTSLSSAHSQQLRASGGQSSRGSTDRPTSRTTKHKGTSPPSSHGQQSHPSSDTHSRSSTCARVVNPSNESTRSTASGSRMSSPLPDQTPESSGPQAMSAGGMNEQGPSQSLPPYQLGKQTDLSHATYRKQAWPGERQNPKNWEVKPPRCHDAPRSLDASLTDVKRAAGRTMSPPPEESEVYEDRDDNGESSDTALLCPPLSKRSRKRYSTP